MIAYFSLSETIEILILKKKIKNHGTTAVSYIFHVAFDL